MAVEKVLVTGGAGFIGSHLVDGLLAKGYKVRVLDNFTTGKKRNLSSTLSDIELITGDIRLTFRKQKLSFRNYEMTKRR